MSTSPLVIWHPYTHAALDPAPIKISRAEGVDLYADRGGSVIPEVVAAASAAGVEIQDVHISEPSLENFFLHHTGRSLRE